MYYNVVIVFYLCGGRCYKCLQSNVAATEMTSHKHEDLSHYILPSHTLSQHDNEEQQNNNTRQAPTSTLSYDLACIALH